MLDPASLRNCVAAVLDPATGVTLGALDRVHSVAVVDGVLEVRLRLDAPLRAPAPALVAGIEAAARELEGVTGARVQFELAITGRALTEDDPVPTAKNVLLVMSGKGGVGKSTVAANLALALSKMGARVGLLDADIYGPSVPTLFGVHSQPLSDGQRILPIERHGIKLMSIGFLLETQTTAVIWRGPMLHGALMQFLKDVAWGELDYLLLDMPPGTGDIALTLSQRLHSNGAVLVTTPQEVALQDVYKSVAMNQKVGIPALGVVENQSYFECGNCSTRHELFGSGGGQKVADMAGAPLLGQLPLNPAVREWSDAGTPIVAASPGSPAAQAFFEVAERLGARVAEQNAAAAAAPEIDRSGGQNRILPIVR